MGSAGRAFYAVFGTGSQAVIRTNYDREADVLHVRFGLENARYDSSEEVAPGVFLEFDTDGKPIGVEVISARRRAAEAPSEWPQVAE